MTYVDLLKSLALYCRPEALLFDISREGQGRSRLGFYGLPAELAGAMDPLLLRLQERFYLRRRRRGFIVH